MLSCVPSWKRTSNIVLDDRGRSGKRPPDDRRPVLTPHQQRQARKRLDAGETQRSVPRSYNVSQSTITPAHLRASLRAEEYVIWVSRTAAVGISIMIAATSSTFATTVIGIGSGDCGSWIDNENKAIAANSQVNWILGFLSALNATRSDGVDILAGQSDAGIYLAIHNYCVAHPTGWVEDAAFDVANQLSNQHRRAK
jgi:hypothetical protein